MPARHLIVGLDGFDLGVLQSLEETHTPNLRRLMNVGAYAALQSVMPPATLPNWTTFLTGVNPGVHGVFDFTTRNGYSVAFTAGSAREVPTWFSRLDAAKLRCACLFFPATWPPESLNHGVFISGWDAPVAFDANRSFVSPPELHDEIVRKFGPIMFDDVDEFHAGTIEWSERLVPALTARIERKVALCEWLLERESWDVFAVYFGESDTASHYLWSLHDHQSPRRPHRLGEAQSAGLTQIYNALDAAVETIHNAATRAPDSPSPTELTVLSDHGSGGSSDQVLFLNRALRDLGLLTFRQSKARPSWVGRAFALAKSIALRVLPPSLRQKVFRFRGALLPGWLESRVRFGDIDFSRTVAFSEELNYFPSVHLNVAGREPQGIVDPSRLTETLQLVKHALMQLRDPHGAPVVRHVWERKELFSGPWVDRAPDLLLDLWLDRDPVGGYSYNLMPSSTSTPTDAVWHTLQSDEWLGRKGRSLPGSHRGKGFFLAHGPSVAPVGEIDAHITDVAPTVLARIGVAVPPEFDGRVLWEALQQFNSNLNADPVVLPAATVRPSPAQSSHDTSNIERRLRALGYID